MYIRHSGRYWNTRRFWQHGSLKLCLSHIMCWRFSVKTFQTMFLPWCTLKSEFSSQENLCLQSLGSQGSLHLYDCRTRTSHWHLLDLTEPFTAEVGPTPWFFSLSVTDSKERRPEAPICLCHRSSQNLSELNIPHLRIRHLVVFVTREAKDHNARRAVDVPNFRTDASHVTNPI